MSTGELKIAMTIEESDFFKECLSGVRRYYEYGIGGSTLFAWNLLNKSGLNFKVFGIDTSSEWVEKVKAAINDDMHVELEFLNIGPTENWGHPVDKTPNLELWPLYPMGIYRILKYRELDLVLIDGRFRVACLIQTVLACQTFTKILIHDYENRPFYHVIEKWVSKKKSVGTLALFEKKELTKNDVLEMQKAFLTYWRVLD